MSDYKTCLTILERYLKARILFISFRTSERSRALEAISDVAAQFNLHVYFHTISKGTRDIATNRLVNDDRSVPGGMEFAGDQISQQENLTFVYTEIKGLDSDTPNARQLQDLAMMAADRGGSLVVITSDSVWSPLQRLGMSLTLDPPNEDEMLDIIQAQISPYRNMIPVEWTLTEEKEAAAILAGISRIEAENILATLLAKKAIKNDDLNDLMHAKDRIFSDISGIERVSVQQDYKVGGLEGLKKWLNANQKLLTADLRSRGIRPPRGILLVGVPGCGKSLSAKAISSQWHLPLYRLDLATIHGQYLGQSESRLKEALATAEHVAPCVLWIDEIEKGLAGAGGNSDGGTSTRMVGHFLYWLQESPARVFVVATANEVTRLPAELLRRGRFDELFFVDLPTESERAEIIQIYVRKGLKKAIGKELLQKLVELSNGFSGADIEAAVRDVVKYAIIKGDDELSDDVFTRYFENVVPLSQTSPERIESIRKWGRARAVPAGTTIGENSANDKARQRGPRSVLI